MEYLLEDTLNYMWSCCLNGMRSSHYINDLFLLKGEMQGLSWFTRRKSEDLDIIIKISITKDIPLEIDDILRILLKPYRDLIDELTHSRVTIGLVIGNIDLLLFI